MIRIITTKRLRELEAQEIEAKQWKSFYEQESRRHEEARRNVARVFMGAQSSIPERDIGAENRRRNAEQLFADKAPESEEDIPSTFPGLYSLGPDFGAIKAQAHAGQVIDTILAASTKKD